jgi:hypothetical protein
MLSRSDDRLLGLIALRLGKGSGEDWCGSMSVPEPPELKSYVTSDTFRRMRVVMRSTLAFCALTFLGTSQMFAGTVTAGTARSLFGDCALFGCAQYYQQLYANDFFSGPVTITGITFFHTQDNSGNGVDPASYTFRLTTTSIPDNGLTADFWDNLGDESLLFYTGNLPSTMPFGSSLTITGTSFFYDPSLGNLLLSVEKSSRSGSNNAVYLDTDYGLVNMSRAVGADPAGSVQATNNYGYVTQFTTVDAPAPVLTPEPTTFVLVAGALFACGLSRLTRPTWSPSKSRLHC